MARKSSSPGLPSQRQLRAGELVRHAISDILAREDFRDPDLVGVIVTVGEVRCSPDLRHANIFVSPLGNDSEEGRTHENDAHPVSPRTSVRRAAQSPSTDRTNRSGGTGSDFR